MLWDSSLLNEGMWGQQVLYNADDLEDVLAALSERAASASQASVLRAVLCRTCIITGTLV